MTAAAPRRILVVCTRRLGDVLLVTPLIASLRRAHPQARIEALVFADTAAALAGNADLDAVRPWPRRLRPGRALRELGSLWRAFDLAIAAVASDRAHWLCWIAAPRRAGFTSRETGGWMRRRIAPAVGIDPLRVHSVEQVLRIADALQIARQPQVVPPRAAPAVTVDAPYAVVHATPMFRYKAWPADHWVSLVQGLRARGLRVALTGGPASAEREAVAALAAAVGTPATEVIDLAGRLSLAETTPLLERAAVYVGPDTSMTHLAAACGTAVVALFGPSNPVTWGPWPQGFDTAGDSPWQRVAASQRQGRLRLLQGTQARWPGCIPCLREGCDNHVDSVSDCLDRLPVDRVLAAVDDLLD